MDFAQLGQLKTGQEGKGLLKIYLWCLGGLSNMGSKRIEIYKKNKRSYASDTK